MYVHCDEGRIVRPLLLAPDNNHNNNNGALPWTTAAVVDRPVEQLLLSGALRYVDAAEICTLNVALSPGDRRPDTDLIEVHPHLMLGVTAAMIPLLQCNQSPRRGR